MVGTADRPLYSRADLEALQARDRAGVLDALGSFEERGLAEDDFVLSTARLLDPKRVPGLAPALERGDAAQVLKATFAACTDEGAAGEAWSTVPGTIEQAQDVMQHRFTFYEETHQLPEDIDWDFNPGTRHWSHDLNRFWYLRPLVAAWRDTGEERFARKAIELILDWIGKCDIGKAFASTPYMFGSYLNNAIHCEAWSWTLRQMLPEVVRPIELMRILKSLHDQLAYLEIVTNGHSGNWPTIGCRGILATLTALPALRDTDRLADYCVSTMTAQIEDQVLPDGVQDELTPAYHRVVINNLLRAIPSARALGREIPSRTVAVLRKMIHYAQQTALPDGSGMAAFNDSDPARTTDYGPQLTKLGLGEFLSPPERLGPELFPYAGVAFLRQKQDKGDLYLAFDGGPFGRGHQHEDKLGFCLFAYGRGLIVDPGRHRYDPTEASYRPYLVTTRAHSTITVDGQDQHSRARPDLFIATEPVPLDWRVGEDEIRACATYDLGYGEDNAIAAVHRREIVFVRERFWIVFDRVEGEGEHLIESRFQFAPSEVQLEGASAHTCFPDANLLLRAAASSPFDDVHIEEGQENPRSGWYAREVGHVEPAPLLVLPVETGLPLFAATLLYPFKGAAAPDVQFVLEGNVATVRAEETGELRVESRLEA